MIKGQYTNTIDSKFEFDCFMNSVDFDDKEAKLKTEGVFFELFCGVMRIVHGYTWLRECKRDNELSGIKIVVKFEQDDNGKFSSDILGRWKMTIAISDGVTTEDTLNSILRIMERFVRLRFGIEEPKGLEALALEYKRKQLLEEHFIGYERKEPYDR